MINLITLDGRQIFLNAELVEQIESVPETVITLVNDKKILVRQSAPEVVALIMGYRRAAYGNITLLNP